MSLLSLLLLLALRAAARADSDDGIVRVKSAVPMAEAITRIKADIASKGIKFFIGDRPVEARSRRRHQAAPLDAAGVRQSTARHPVHHLESRTPVSTGRSGLLLTQDDNGDVWAAWTDFGWIAKRHNIRDRAAQFEMATKVVGSITSTITTK